MEDVLPRQQILYLLGVNPFTMKAKSFWQSCLPKKLNYSPEELKIYPTREKKKLFVLNGKLIALKLATKKKWQD